MQVPSEHSKVDVNLVAIPQEILCYILSFLSIKDVITFRFVSKLAKQAADNESLWKEIYSSKYSEVFPYSTRFSYKDHIKKYLETENKQKRDFEKKLSGGLKTYIFSYKWSNKEITYLKLSILNGYIQPIEKFLSSQRFREPFLSKDAMGRSIKAVCPELLSVVDVLLYTVTAHRYEIFKLFLSKAPYVYQLIIIGKLLNLGDGDIWDIICLKKPLDQCTYTIDSKKIATLCTLLQYYEQLNSERKESEITNTNTITGLYNIANYHSLNNLKQVLVESTGLFISTEAAKKSIDESESNRFSVKEALLVSAGSQAKSLKIDVAIQTDPELLDDSFNPEEVQALNQWFKSAPLPIKELLEKKRYFNFPRLVKSSKEEAEVIVNNTLDLSL